MDYFERTEKIGYLDSVIGDLENRVDCFEMKLSLNENLDDRVRTLKNHIKILNLTRIYLDRLWDTKKGSGSI